MKPSILLLNPGDGTGLNFTRSLAETGSWRTVGLSSDADDYHGAETDIRHLVTWDSPDELIDIVNGLIAEHRIDLVYAADTGPELLALSMARDRVSAPMLLPDLADHLRMEDKWSTLVALREAGVEVPDTVRVDKLADLEALFKRHRRIWLRRRHGSAGAGSTATESEAFARAWIDEHNGWGDFTAAECLTSRTATFSGLWHNGELIASQLRERMGWKHPYLSTSGVTGITGAQRTVWDESLHQLAVKCVRATAERPHGAIGVDFTWHQDGRPLPTEVQPARFYSSIYFLSRCGLNLPNLFCTVALRGRQAAGRALINPIRDTHYWVKGVDKLPQLLTEGEYYARG
ncbi:MAG: hypothetical protein ACREUG_18220 [Steroidobacteraceae bacterium]